MWDFGKMLFSAVLFMALSSCYFSSKLHLLLTHIKLQSGFVAMFRIPVEDFLQKRGSFMKFSSTISFYTLNNVCSGFEVQSESLTNKQITKFPNNVKDSDFQRL